VELVLLTVMVWAVPQVSVTLLVLTVVVSMASEKVNVIADVAVEIFVAVPDINDPMACALPPETLSPASVGAVVSEAATVVNTNEAAVTAVLALFVTPVPTAKVHSVLFGMADDGVIVNAELVSPEVTAAIVIVCALLQVRVMLEVDAVLDSIASENVSVNAVLTTTPVVPVAAMVVDPWTRDDTVGAVGVGVLDPPPPPQWATTSAIMGTNQTWACVIIFLDPLRTSKIDATLMPILLLKANHFQWVVTVL
jgi:hypothetical protein